MSTWQPDWEALAQACVHDTMRIRPGERVVIHGDPHLVPAFYEAIRFEILSAGGIDHAHVLGWHGRLPTLRSPFGRHPVEAAAAQEEKALSDLLRTADVFMWLPTSMDPIGCSAGYSEAALGDWEGRGLHFHWFNDWYLPSDDPLQIELAQAMERAVLQLDYDAHRATQDRLVEAIAGKMLRITTPEGTDVRLQLDPGGWYHINDGRVTPEKQRRASCARDREEELPCGSVRSIPVIDSVEGTVRLQQPGKAFGAVGYRLLEYAADLTFEFANGKVIRTHAGTRNTGWGRFWRSQTGSYDEVTEFVVGTNPFLSDIRGLTMPPYWGFGEGYVRLHTGSNTESGGDRDASLSLELWLRGATVTADGDEVIRGGQLLV